MAEYKLVESYCSSRYGFFKILERLLYKLLFYPFLYYIGKANYKLICCLQLYPVYQPKQTQMNLFLQYPAPLYADGYTRNICIPKFLIDSFLPFDFATSAILMSVKVMSANKTQPGNSICIVITLS